MTEPMDPGADDHFLEHDDQITAHGVGLPTDVAPDAGLIHDSLTGEVFSPPEGG